MATPPSRSVPDWLPIFLWLVPSVVTWAVINNMLENTQAVFTSLACYALLRTSDRRPAITVAAWAALAAASVVAATLIKGPVGLFPLTLPVLVLILPAASRPRHPAIVWIAFAAVAGALAAALLATPSARSALGAFMTTHLAPTLGGDRGAGPRGSDFLRHLALGIWLRMAVIVGLVWLFRRRERVEAFMGRPAAFFFAATFASSLPILISPGTRRALTSFHRSRFPPSPSELWRSRQSRRSVLNREAFPGVRPRGSLSAFSALRSSSIDTRLARSEKREPDS